MVLPPISVMRRKRVSHQCPQRSPHLTSTTRADLHEKKQSSMTPLSTRKWTNPEDRMTLTAAYSGEIQERFQMWFLFLWELFYE